VSGESAPSDTPLVVAAVLSIVLVVVAVAGGFAASRLTRPVPSPAPTPTPFVRASPTEAPDTGPLVFAQPLSAGCAAGDAVYVISDGGGIGRFALDRWQLIDSIARTLSAASCTGDQVTAVGGGGRVITIDDTQQTIRSDAVQIEDFLGVAPLAEGVLVVGRAGTVQRQAGGGWGVYAIGIDEDLYGVAAFGPTSAWAVGAGGATYRLEPAGWRPVASGVTVTLRAIAARAVDDAVAVGDDATVLIWNGAWKRVDAPARVIFRAALRVGADTYVAGDQGALFRLSGGAASPAFTRIDLATTCTLRGLFTRGGEVWAVGSDGAQSAVWRISQGSVFRWGQCQ
jgi:hypothetical protein